MRADHPQGWKRGNCHCNLTVLAVVVYVMILRLTVVEFIIMVIVLDKVLLLYTRMTSQLSSTLATDLQPSGSR